MRRIYGLIFVALMLNSCGINSSNSNLVEVINPVENGDFVLKVEDTIVIDELYKLLWSIKIVTDENGVINGFWAHDGPGLAVYKFDQNGSLLKTMVLPSINEPNGINRITDMKILNSDSVFVFDAEFNKVVLFNEESIIINTWKISNYVPAISTERNTEIVDIYKNGSGNLIIDLTGYSNYYYSSDRDFYKKNTLLYQINLESKEVRKGLSYPINSPYRKYLFWSGNIPYVRKLDSAYLAVFAHDEHLYFYGHDLEELSSYSTNPRNFPDAVGNEFGSKQIMNYARIDRKINGYNQKISDVFKTKTGRNFSRIYSAPLGDNPNIPDDYLTFMKGDYRSKYYLQVFNLDDIRNGITKVYPDLEVGNLNIGSLLYIDFENRYYFLEKNTNKEETRILVARIVRKSIQ
uniref:hypothetical protein n=2 Tax=Roseivirga sp. TaxID=1964215 RepID=UPI004047193A